MSLLERFANGDLDAFETLFRQFQGKVYGCVVRVIRDPGTAEDLTLEAFWRMYRARGRFDPQADFGAWAYRIAMNLALSHLRHKSREVEWREQEPQSRAPDPALQQEVSERVRRAFTRLPARLQLTAIMALVDERPYDEIAGALNIAPGTVKSRVFRAVRIMRKQLSHFRVHT